MSLQLLQVLDPHGRTSFGAGRLRSPEAPAFFRAHRNHQLEERRATGPAYASQGLVFTQSNGNPYEPGQISKAFAKLLLKGELPAIRFHDLRHATSTMLLSAARRRTMWSCV